MSKLFVSISVALIFIVEFCLTTLHAQEVSIQTDRPDQTETPFIVPKNYFQVEAGFIYEKGDEITNNYQHPGVLYKSGVNKNLELRLITEFETRNSGKAVSGLTPVLVGFKAKLMEEKGCLPTTSFIGHLAIPTFASKKFQATYYAPAFRFTMQHTLSERLSLSYNLGAEWDGESAEPTFIYTLSTGFAIAEKVGSYVELYGFAPQKNQADHRLDGGLTYLVSPNAQLDVSGGIGLSSNAPKYFVSMGFSFRFNTL